MKISLNLSGGMIPNEGMTVEASGGGLGMGLAGRIGIDGRDGTDGSDGLDGVDGINGVDGQSAYEIAVRHGFSGTEEEWAESLYKPALEAADKANSAADNIDSKLASKASLDSTGRFVLNSQIDPLNGLQTGADTSKGFFASTNDDLYSTESKSVEILFTAPATLAGQKYLISTGNTGNLEVFLNGDILTVGVGNGAVTKPGILAGMTYHLVVILDYGEPAVIFLNGCRAGQGDYLRWPGEAFTAGNSIEGGNAFDGVIHRIRIFAHYLRESDAEWLWNKGRPFEISTARHTPAGVAALCLAEYIPQGLLADGWRDTSGNGYYLSKMNAPVFSYVKPADMYEMSISTGRFYDDIAMGVGMKRIDIPEGYFPVSIRARNYNTGFVNNFTLMTYNDETVLISPVTLKNTLFGDQLLWNGGVYAVNKEDYLYANGTGNTSAGGMEITTTFRWVGSI